MSKKISRRQFMALAVGAIGTGAVAVVGLDRLLNNDGDDNATTLTFDPATGELDSETIETLMALVAAYVGDNGTIAHYQAYFTWRAANLPEYLSTYQAFAVALDEAARELSGQSFTLTDDATREQILRYGLELPDPASGLTDPQIFAETAPDDLAGQLLELWLRFDRMVIGEMVNVFLNTNGWIMLGYPAYPGQPRGLETYQQPVTGSES